MGQGTILMRNIVSFLTPVATLWTISSTDSSLIGAPSPKLQTPSPPVSELRERGACRASAQELFVGGRALNLQQSRS